MVFLRFSHVFCSYMIFIFMICQVMFWSRTTKILISHCFLQQFWAVGTFGKTVFFRLFQFLSWAICKNHWFSLGFPMFFANTWSSFSWSLKSFFGHAQRKYWFHIVFYSIFEPWAHLEKLSFVDFFTFSRERFLKIIGFPLVFSHVFCLYIIFIFTISQVIF